MDFSDVLKGYKKEKSIMISPDDITPNPLQPRRRFDIDELQSLAESIKIYGVIQPIAVKRIEQPQDSSARPVAKFEIIAGERRWRASKIAGMKRIPCTVFEVDRESSATMALIENLQRSDLSYFEEALAMNTLLLITGKTQNQLASDLSISQSTLSNKLRLLKLSERERLMALENGFSERHCRALVRIESERERRPLMLKIISEKLQAPETEKLVDEYLFKRLFPETPKKEKTNKQKPIIKGSIGGDMRFFYNTVDKAVKLLHNSGYSATWCKEEAESALEIKIRITKAT